MPPDARITERELETVASSSVFLFPAIRGYRGLSESPVMFVGAHANAGWRRVPVDTVVKCLMHVKGTRSTGGSQQLTLQSRSSLLCVIFECEGLGDDTAGNSSSRLIQLQLGRSDCQQTFWFLKYFYMINRLLSIHVNT